MEETRIAGKRNIIIIIIMNVDTRTLPALSISGPVYLSPVKERHGKRYVRIDAAVSINSDGSIASGGKGCGSLSHSELLQ